MASAEKSKIEVARSDDTVFVRVRGLGNMNNSTTFKGFVDDMVDRGYRRFIVDLARCQGVDSTFMGILLGIRMQGSGEVVVLNVEEHCRKQLSSVGLDKILTITAGATETPSLAMHELDERKCSSEERMRIIRKAHENLVALDGRNRVKFGAFLDALERDLGRD